MRSRTLLSIAALAMFLAAPTALFSQSIYVGGGATFPTGEFGDTDEASIDATGAKTGWLGMLGFTYDIGGGGLWVGAEGFYGQNSHETEGEKTNPYGGMALLGYGTGDGESLGVYFWGGGGLMVHKFSSDDTAVVGTSDSNFGYQFGAGLDFPLAGSTELFVEGRYMGATGTSFFGIMAGLSFGFAS